MVETKKNFALEIIKKIHTKQNIEDCAERLKTIISIIAEETKATSVDVYIKADDVTFEHVVGTLDGDYPAIRAGEGVVGKAGMDNHISFVKNKKSFQLATPIMRWNKSIGVLLLSYKKTHDYNEEEVDALETLCMFVSELLSSEEISAHIKKIIKSRGIVSKDRLKGTVINSGCGLGNVVVHRRRKAVTKMFSKDKDKELENLTLARQKMNDDLDEKMKKDSMQSGEHVEILDAYRMIANDKGWYNRITNHINSGLTAEAAVEQAYTEMWNRLSGATDTYLKERLHDLRDIADRLRLYLSGEDCNADYSKYDDIVIVATSMGPADLMDYDYKKIRGLIIEECTPTMHVSIVAKALGVPVISGIYGFFKEVKDGALIGINGKDGSVYVNPEKSVIEKINKQIEEKKKELQQIEKLKNLKTKTKDSEKVNLYLNIGMDFDIESTCISEASRLSARELPTKRTVISYSARPRILSREIRYI